MKIWYRLSVYIGGELDSTVDSTDYSRIIHFQQELALKGIESKVTEFHSD